MNYLPFVSWGVYGGTTTAEIANFYASWGLVEDLPAYDLVVLLCGLMHLGLGMDLS